MDGNEGHAMKAAGLMLALVAAALAGCSAELRADDGRAARRGQAAPHPSTIAPARAFQVGTASARAVKCGFNFDPAKLKTNYLAYEKQQPGGQDTAKVERIYDVSFNGVAKAVAAEGDYCSDAKTKRSRPTSPATSPATTRRTRPRSSRRRGCSPAGAAAAKRAE